MADGKLFPLEDLPGQYFSGARRITDDGGEFPGLPSMLNALRKIGGGEAGEGTILNGTALIAVVFATPFEAGTTVRVLVTAKADPGVGNNVWLTAISETGFTINTTGAVGADTAFDYLAVAE